MRVIAGTYKGRCLKTIKGKQTRPTTDKIKESFFHMIGPYFNGGICLDLFAGSGALGIEAISRGMEKAIFIEKNLKAIKIIHENVKSLGLYDKVEIYRTDAYRALQILKKKKLQFHLILLDPPYKQININDYITFIINNKLLIENGLIYYEHEAMNGNPKVDLKLNVIKRVNYGRTTGITIYQNKKDNH